jgi:Rps23 Pro-64 3,4-dihydroxylase Tpa1-like proline 4-hydroxylase
MIKNIIIFLFTIGMISSCQPTEKKQSTPTPSGITETTIAEAIKSIGNKTEGSKSDLTEKGVRHAASLWRDSDGTPEDFVKFCSENYVADPAQKEASFYRFAEYLESLNGHFNKLSLDMQENVQLMKGEVLPIDAQFAAYNPGAHLINDFYDNKIAFIVALNFPYYPTEEKNISGPNWTPLQWGYARLGDVFSSRVPSELVQQASKVAAEGEAYIADYNIYMGNILNDDNQKLFPENMVLLSHWNLRDEIKANYANKEIGFKKQALIYQIMQRIIDQSIPKMVINSGKQDWNPATNEVFVSGTKTEAQPENDGRYQQILNNFHVYQAFDKYEPSMPTAIQRAFSAGMQIPQPEVQKLFNEFLSSPQVQEVAAIVKKRLGRDLSPWDIWYDGFKARSSINEESLNAITEKKYPNAAALEADLGNILLKLGFTKEKAAFIASRVSVDPARGSGHAWGASMKAEKAHLRTRIPATGMNYKGYNIAVHEFGHNVEQTISLNDVPNYMINGVPNTAFTEALAFVFQERDLFLLNMKDTNPEKEYLKTLDIFWSLYEIMGVSMVDMKMWQWLYANPNSTAAELRDAVLQISKDVWNTYYAPVFGMKDQTILGIYSHMINSPMYLPNYAFGHLIHFQLEEHFKTHEFAPEVLRIFALGQLTPNEWMKQAVGTPLSNEAILKATDVAVKKLK